MARCAVVVAAVVALCASAASARADSILYRCFPNICRVATDGSGMTQVTRDGVEPGPVYPWLSGSRDGSRLGVSFGNRVHVLDAGGRHLAGPLPHSGSPSLVTQISPDGAQIASIETIVETVTPFPGGPPVPRPTPYLFVANSADGSGRESWPARPRRRTGSAVACCATRTPTPRRSSSRSACWHPTPTSPASAWSGRGRARPVGSRLVA